MRQTTLTINTAEVEDAFADTTENTITPTLEIELTQGGTPKTIFQGTATIRKDLITAGSTVPGARDSYYTKAESNALFIEDDFTNIDSNARVLCASDASYSVDYGSRTLIDNTYTPILSWGNSGLTLQGTYASFQNSSLGFYSTTATAQPANINVVSGLINVGLIANGSTYGVLPQSKETLTVTTSLNFGTVANNSSNSITVSITGAAVNDVVLLGIPSAVSEGLTFFGHVVAADQVHVDAVNATNASKTQSAVTFRITVIGY
jgi:hypothetical protein